jgi:NTE family protein
MASRERPSATRIALVFSGGIGLGAYQARAYEALQEREDLRLDWISGSSVGAVNAALIAGTPREGHLEALRAFWMNAPFGSAVLPGANIGGPWRHAQNWMSVLQARLFGAWGHFHPRLASSRLDGFASLYDLSPMRRRIEKLVDFERLNNGDIRVCVATTDVETGDLVVFDTRKATGVAIEHLLASCGFLPEFAPVEIDGRLLGDAGLSANAPFEPVLASREAVRPVARDSRKPLAGRNARYAGGPKTIRQQQRCRAAGDCPPEPGMTAAAHVSPPLSSFSHIEASSDMIERAHAAPKSSMGMSFPPLVLLS